MVDGTVSFYNDAFRPKAAQRGIMVMVFLLKQFRYSNQTNFCHTKIYAERGEKGGKKMHW